MSNLHRRDVICRGLQFLSVTAVLSLSGRGARAAEACVDPAPEAKSLRADLHYADPAPDAAQPCRACAFFTPQKDKSACGSCTILNGPTSAKGHCDSWSKKE